MALKSMKVTKEDREAKEKRYASPCIDNNDYPYELRISLSTEQIDKLGLKMPKTGASFKLSASGTVTSTEVSDRNGKEDKRISLQIEKLEVTV